MSTTPYQAIYLTGDQFQRSRFQSYEDARRHLCNQQHPVGIYARDENVFHAIVKPGISQWRRRMIREVSGWLGVEFDQVFDLHCND